MISGRTHEMTSGSPTKKRLIKKPTPKPKPETQHEVTSTRRAFAMVHMPVFEYLAHRDDACQLGWLYTYLLARVHTDGGWKISHAEMAKAIGKSPRMVRRYLDELKHLGLIEWETTYINGGASLGWNKYIVHEDWRPKRTEVSSGQNCPVGVSPVTPPSGQPCPDPPVMHDPTLPAPVTAPPVMGGLHNRPRTEQEQTNDRPTTTGRKPAVVVDSVGLGLGSAEAQVSRPVKPNKWDDTCIHCGKHVKARASRLVGKKVAHLEGECEIPTYVIDPRATRREDFGW